MAIMKRVFFDIETEPFTASFQCARTTSERELHAPKMRLACAYIQNSRKYKYFYESDANKLISLLISSDEIVSFNGHEFDELVLRRHYGLAEKIPKNGTHIDIHKIMSNESGYRVSLDKAVKLNFGERKHTSGREMTILETGKLEEACRSDVNQTYRLWKSLQAGTLIHAPKATTRIEVVMGPGHHMPNMCPMCHDVGSLRALDLDTEEMTEGQWSEYISGMYGEAYCLTCEYIIEWEV